MDKAGMNPVAPSGNTSSAGGVGPVEWFCVQTHPKHEHIAAGHMTNLCGIEVFNPKIRTRRSTARGPVWFTESLFPGYVFARFDLARQLDQVKYCPAVSQVVRFGHGYPVVPEAAVEELRNQFGPGEIVVAQSSLAEGDTVRIVGGAFRDLLAVVRSIQPGKDRVQALLEFLGTTAVVELAMGDFVVEQERHLGARGQLPILQRR
jgi:transcriptional antiterminator RfaH